MQPFFKRIKQLSSLKKAIFFVRCFEAVKFGLSNLFDRGYRRFKVWMIENCNLGLKSTMIESDFEAGLVMSEWEITE